MALNGSGPISLGGATAGQSIAVELGLSPTGAISLNQSNVRTLAGVPSGAIIMPTNFYGKANAFNFTATISSNTTNYNLRSAAVAAGWDQVIALNASVTINSGVTISATSTGVAAFDTGVSFPAGTTLSITNSGSILGLGGAGGVGGTNAGNGATGSIGGNAFRAQAPITVNNLGTFSSGNGGQGGGAAVRTGGTSGTTTAGCAPNIACTSSPRCNNGFCNTDTGPTGATGESTGTNGATGTAGSSASFGNARSCVSPCGIGPGCNQIVACTTGTPGAGGLAGAAVVGNSNITWTAFGTRNGAIT